jgi:hypothetical protein
MRVLANPIQFSTKKFSLSFSLSLFFLLQSIIQIEMIDVLISPSLSLTLSLCVLSSSLNYVCNIKEGTKISYYEVTSLLFLAGSCLIFFLIGEI